MFGGFGGMFNDDPFFNGQDESRSQRSRSSRNQLARHEQRNDPFAMMDQMTNQMGMGMHGMHNMGSMMRHPGGDPFGNFDMMNMGGPIGAGGGQFHSQTMVTSSRMGPDGQMHTEKFASSSHGDANKKIHQSQQAYSNSASGVEKMSMERQMNNRGKKVVKSKTHGQDETQTEMFMGMEDHEAGEFDRQWEHNADPHMRNMQQATRHQTRNLMDTYQNAGNNRIEDRRQNPRRQQSQRERRRQPEIEYIEDE